MNNRIENLETEKITKTLELLENLTLLETASLVHKMEKLFGIDISVSIPALSSSSVIAAAPVEAVEEKTTFDILLTEVPADKKIAILKIVRNVTGLGLKESKDIVDNIPKILKEGVTKEEGEKIQKEIETAGGKILMK